MLKFNFYEMKFEKNIKMSTFSIFNLSDFGAHLFEVNSIKRKKILLFFFINFFFYFIKFFFLHSAYNWHQICILVGKDSNQLYET